MKKSIFLIALATIFAHTLRAQQGIQIMAQFGLSDVGDEIWYETNGDFTGAIIFPINSTWSVGGFYTFAPNASYSVFGQEEVELDAEASEFGLISRYTILRPGKFNIYLQNTVSYLTVDNTGNPQALIDQANASGREPVIGEESTIGIGVGVGVNLRLTQSLFWNIFEFDATFIESEFMNIDRNVHLDYKTGLIYQFQKRK